MDGLYIVALVIAAIGVALIVAGLRTTRQGGADAWGGEVIGIFFGGGLVILGIVVAAIRWAVLAFLGA
jgi:hypothetical protein